MINLHKVDRKLKFNIDGEEISVGVKKLDAALSIELGDRQRLIDKYLKESVDVEKSDKTDIEKSISMNEILSKMHLTYIDMFKLCVIDYSIIEKIIDEIPYSAYQKFVEILNEITYEMNKTEERIEKKN